MEQTFNNSQTNKRSMPALVIMIIAFAFIFLHYIINLVLGKNNLTFSNFFNLLIQTSPMVLLVIYMIAFQNKQMLTVFVPLAIILLNFSIFQDFINSFGYVDEYGYTLFAPMSTLFLVMCHHVPMLIFTAILIADAFKGFKKNGLVIAYSIFSFIYSFLSRIPFLARINVILYYLSPAFIISYLFNLFACILFPIALILFAKNGNVPSICKPKKIVEPQTTSTNSNTQVVEIVKTENQSNENVAVSCPNCGEKFENDAIFCTKCGHKR